MKKQNKQRVKLELRGNLLKPADLRKLKSLLHKTQVDRPKSADLRALRHMLEETPDLWSGMSELANVSMEMILKGTWLGPGVRTVIEAGRAGIRSDLGYTEAPALEKMLIDHIIVSWLQMQKAHILYENALREAASLPVAGYWERRLTVSQARFLRASETLARVRKLSRPSALQVNIGARQLNVAQAGRKEGEAREE